MADKQEPSAVLAEESGPPASSIGEKAAVEDAAVPSRAERLHEFHESEGYLINVDTAAADASGLRLAKDGHTVLIPQPSDDVNDPLNWSWAKKHLILFIVSFVSFFPDYGSATGAVTLIPQAEYVFPQSPRRSFW